MTKPQQNGMCAQQTQICLGIHPVWLESSLSTWRKIGSLATHRAHSELIRLGRCPGWSVFAGRTVILLVLSWGDSLVWPSQRVTFWSIGHGSHLHSDSCSPINTSVFEIQHPYFISISLVHSFHQFSLTLVKCFPCILTWKKFKTKPEFPGKEHLLIFFLLCTY